MKKYALAFLLLLLMTSLTMGWDLSLVTGISVKNALLYLVTLLLLIETAAIHNRSFDLPRVLLPFCLLVAYASLSWLVMSFVLQLWNYDAFTAAIALKNELIDHFVVFLIFYYGIVSNPNETLSLVRFLLGMTMIGHAITVIDAFDIPDLGIIDQRDDGRVSGPVGESNAYGAYIAMTLPGCIALALESRGIAKWVATGGVFVTVLALFLASSRGAFAGLLAGSLLGLAYLHTYISVSRVAFGMTAVILGVSGALVVLYSTGYLSLLEERFVESSTGAAYDVSSSRTAIWKMAMLRIAEYPHTLLIGFGWDAYDHMRGLFPKSIHSFYLNKLFNLGIPGLVLSLATFFGILRTCRGALSNASDAVRIHLMACVFGSLALGGAIVFIDLHAPWIFIWAYLGLCMRLAVQSHSERPAELTQLEGSVLTRPAW